MHTRTGTGGELACGAQGVDTNRANLARADVNQPLLATVLLRLGHGGTTIGDVSCMVHSNSQTADSGAHLVSRAGVAAQHCTCVHGHSQRGCSPLQSVLRSTGGTQGHTTPSASDALVRNYVTNARVYRHTNWLASKTGVDAGADLGLAVSALGRLP